VDVFSMAVITEHQRHRTFVHQSAVILLLIARHVICFDCCRPTKELDEVNIQSTTGMLHCAVLFRVYIDYAISQY